MRDIKHDFETVARENTAWLLGYVRSKVGNRTIAEDLTQEILLKAYRAYDSYHEEGRLRPWLMRIARNHLRNYFSRDAQVRFFSLDVVSDEDEDSLYAYLSDGQTPEDRYLQKELTESVLEVVARLPARQRQVFTYRFIEDRKLSEIAGIMQIPVGSVKSASHYAVGRIRAELGLEQISAIPRQKGDKIMECKEAYKYLFIYVNNTITDGDRLKVEEHIKSCKVCADVVSALQRLIPHLTFAREDEKTHFLIDFPQLGLTYCGVRTEIENYEELNRLLEKWGGNIPEDSTWMGGGYGSSQTMIGTFDNEGNEIKKVIVRRDGSHTNDKAVYIKKMFHYMWEYIAYVYEESPCGIRKAKEAPGLYYGTERNCFGRAVKTAIYQAIPGAAENVRIKRGNGVIDCGTYQFPYADRYVMGDEKIDLDYSFNFRGPLENRRIKTSEL